MTELISRNTSRLDVAKRLSDILRKPGIKVRVAASCDRTQQAVTGWVKTGRVDEKHPLIIAEVTGKSVNWILYGEERLTVSDTEMLLVLAFHSLNAPATKNGSVTA